jgi:hypothetical protein
VPAGMHSGAQPRADEASVSRFFPDNKPLSPRGEWEVPDGSREEWIREVAQAIEQDEVALVGNLAKAWNKLIGSRGRHE